MSARFLLADDHAILLSILHSHHPQVELVEAGDGAAAIKCAEELKPDLIILDIHLPDQSGMEVARQIRTRVPSTRIIMMSADPDPSYAKQAFKAGASAYLLKTRASDRLPAAVSAILAGKPYVCSEPSAAVVIAYDDVPAGKHAMIVLQQVTHSLGETLRLRPLLWRLDLLADPDWRAEATAEAKDAVLVIVSASGDLPAPAWDWIQECLRQRPGGRRALVVSLSRQEGLDGWISPRLHSLKQAAEAADLEFFGSSSPAQALAGARS